MSRPRLLWIVGFWVVAVIVGSLLPYDAKQAMGTKRSIPAHRIYHFVAFGGTALLGMAMARNRGQRAAVAAGVFTLGAGLEVAQHLYYGNVLEWWDIRDDGFGVVAAVALFGLIRLLPRQFRQE